MTDDNQDQAEADRPPQETVSFTFDRMTVARFRETFPNARWSDRLQAWTVPGKTAVVWQLTVRLRSLFSHLALYSRFYRPRISN